MFNNCIQRSLHFCAAHRVLGHEGKCASLHGHEYTADILVTAAENDQLGRVLDFGVVKEKIGGWIDEHWDHNSILHEADPLLTLPKEEWYKYFGPKVPWIMQGNPTAENLARELYIQADRLLRDCSVELVAVTIHETPNCQATWAPDARIGEV